MTYQEHLALIGLPGPTVRAISRRIPHVDAYTGVVMDGFSDVSACSHEHRSRETARRCGALALAAKEK